MSHASIVRKNGEKKNNRQERSGAPQDPRKADSPRPLAHEHWAVGEDRPLMPSLLRMLTLSGATPATLKERLGEGQTALESWVDYEARPLELATPGFRMPSRLLGSGPLSRRPPIPVQREAEGAPQVEGEAVQQVAEAGARGGGGEVPYRAELEHAFGADFSGVKAYTGETASLANQALGAKAYTMGESVVFRDSSPDKQTVGHELTHVLQQRAGKVATPQGKGGVINADIQLEAEADRAGEAFARGEAVQRLDDSSASSGAPVAVIQRAVDGRRPDVDWSTIYRALWPDAPAYVKRQPDKHARGPKPKKGGKSDLPQKPKPGVQDAKTPDQKPPKIHQPKPVFTKLVLPVALRADARRLALLHTGYKEVFLCQWIKLEQQHELRAFAKETGDVAGNWMNFRKLEARLRRQRRPEKNAKSRQAFEVAKKQLALNVGQARAAEGALSSRAALSVVWDTASSYPSNLGRVPSVVRILEKKLRLQYQALEVLLKKRALPALAAKAMFRLTKSIHHDHKLHSELSVRFRLAHNWHTRNHLSPDALVFKAPLPARRGARGPKPAKLPTGRALTKHIHHAHRARWR